MIVCCWIHGEDEATGALAVPSPLATWMNGHWCPRGWTLGLG